MPDEIPRYHVYHAEAAIFEGNLKLPFSQNIGSHTYSKLNEQGGYVTQHSQNIRLGGAISVDSDAGAGTTFRFTLPARERAETAAA